MRVAKRTTVAMISILMITLGGCQSTPGLSSMTSMMGGFGGEGSQSTSTSSGSSDIPLGPFEGFPDIGFLISDAPDFSDDIEKMFYYADKTDILSTGAVEHGDRHYQLLIEQLAITVARMTLENQQQLLQEFDALAGRAFSLEEKRIIEEALKEMAISRELATKTLFATGQLIYTTSQIPEEVESNPIRYGGNAPSYLQKTPGMLTNLKNLQQNLSSYISLNGAISEKIAEIAGVEVPTPETEEVEEVAGGILGSEVEIT